MVAYGGGGDIWSTGAFSFESPLKDLLDSGSFTVEQLLAEDELLQELRGCHQTLISFFSTERAVTKLVRYLTLSHNEESETIPESKVEPEESNNPEKTTTPIVTDGEDPPKRRDTKEPGAWLTDHLLGDSTTTITKDKHPELDPEMLNIRFPFMACEIFCLEIPSVIETLVTGKAVVSEESPPQTEIVTTTESDDVEVIQSSSVNKDTAMAVITATESTDAAFLENHDYNHTLLDSFFSLLYDTKAGELDDYRAGYFDKVLTVLFRKRPEELTVFLNTNGRYRGQQQESLMQALLKHLYSHSIMQIAQRLLIPQKPTGKPSMEGGDEEDGTNCKPEDDNAGDDIIIAGADDSNEAKVFCDWSSSSEALDLLLDMLMSDNMSEDDVQDDEQRLDLSLNASEVLITIIQNSMLSSNTMLSLTQSGTVLRIITAATVLPVGHDYFSQHESMLTSAMNVLESLILQLGGYGAVGTMSLVQGDDDPQNPQNQIDLSDPNGNDDIFRSDSDEQEGDQPSSPSSDVDHQQQIGDQPTLEDTTYANEDEEDKQLIADLGSILEHLPFMLDNLSNLLRHPSTSTWKSPMQYADHTDEPDQQLLGNSRLRIVRVLESLVLLGDPDVDAILVQQAECLEICLDFFWQFQWCSMLHQSVANLLVHVFEGQNTRYEMQEFFLHKCNLLGRLMNSFLRPDEIAKNDANAIIENNAQVTVITSEQGDDASTHSNNISSPQAPSPVQIEGIIVENLDDLDEVEDGSPTGVELLTAALLESGDISKGNTNNLDSLPVSEDDVDAAMEQGNINTEQLSTEAVRYESREASVIGGASAAPSAQSFRYGYMGHVIIICQALVNAYMHDNEGQDIQMQQPQQSQDTLLDGQAVPLCIAKGEVGDTEEDTYIGPKDDFGDPLLLAELVSQHPLAERWHEFVATTLAAENAIQSTLLGGYNMQASSSGGMMMIDPLHSHRPGLIDEGYMMGDDGEGPPAPPLRGMLAGGDVIDMDDNDLDIAASMMAGLTLNRNSGNSRRTHNSPRSNNSPKRDDDDSEDGASYGSADSEKSYNSGETNSEKSAYVFDDPLGKAGGLGIELGKLTQYDHSSSNKAARRNHARSNNPKPEDQADDDEIGSKDSHSSSSDDEYQENHERNDSDVPVLDLFAGNFNFDGDEQPPSQDEESPGTFEFADFANFQEGEGFFAEKSTEPVVASNNDERNDTFDDDFGPFASAEENPFPSVSLDFGNFETVVIDVPEPCPVQPIKSSEFEEIFGGPGDHLELLEQDDADISPAVTDATQEPSSPDIIPSDERNNPLVEILNDDDSNGFASNVNEISIQPIKDMSSAQSIDVESSEITSDAMIIEAAMEKMATS